MKVVEVGNFRVLLDDLGEGDVVIDHARDDGSDPGKRLVLEPRELQDLLVALDGVQGDMRPPANETVLHKIRAIMQEAEHKLYVLGFRHRMEIHVEHHVLHGVAHEANVPIKYHPDRSEVFLGGYGRLMAVRGKRI